MPSQLKAIILSAHISSSYLEQSFDHRLACPAVKLRVPCRPPRDRHQAKRLANGWQHEPTSGSGHWRALMHRPRGSTLMLLRMLPEILAIQMLDGYVLSVLHDTIKSCSAHRE